MAATAFTEADIRRALKGAKEAGVAVVIEIDRETKVMRILPADALPVPNTSAPRGGDKPGPADDYDMVKM